MRKELAFRLIRGLGAPHRLARETRLIDLVLRRPRRRVGASMLLELQEPRPVASQERIGPRDGAFAHDDRRPFRD
jgi:hypothetical protein